MSGPDDVLRNAFFYFSEELMKLRVEAGWRRRDIHIRHKNGEALYDWEWSGDLHIS